MSVLDDPVLVLNKGWIAVETCSMMRAFARIFGEKAKIINTDDCSMHDFMSWAELDVGDHPAIRTSRMNIRALEVIVLNSDAKVGRRKDSVSISRRGILKRDRHTCQYCGGQSRGDEKLTIDHVMPKCRGGRFSWLNCVASCFNCNIKKANRTPEEAGMHLRTKPHEPRWSPIFRVAHSHYKPSWEQFVGSGLLNR